MFSLFLKHIVPDVPGAQSLVASCVCPKHASLHHHWLSIVIVVSQILKGACIVGMLAVSLTLWLAPQDPAIPLWDSFMVCYCFSLPTTLMNGTVSIPHLLALYISIFHSHHFSSISSCYTSVAETPMNVSQWWQLPAWDHDWKNRNTTDTYGNTCYASIMDNRGKWAKSPSK